MTSPDIFIGLVSHANSRFVENLGGEGVAQTLSRELMHYGLNVAVQVNIENLYDPRTRPLVPRMSIESVAGELSLERRWHHFLGSKNSLRFRLRMLVRRVHLAWERVRGGDTATVERLLNIEYSHLDLMRAGLDSGASWILILEDDAGIRDLKALRELFIFLIHADTQSKIVSLSDSFSIPQLGVSHLLRPHGPLELNILCSERPVTNTVCAIAYRRNFLRHLVQALETLPIEPIVPIDWRVNEALIALWDQGDIGAGECWLIDPAPIVQLSMHDPH